MALKANCLYSQVAVLGGGKFGTAVAQLLAKNAHKVFIYIRNKDKYTQAKSTRILAGTRLPDNVEPLNHMLEAVAHCGVVFPMIPAQHFRQLMQAIAPQLSRDHILIHGIKGLDYSNHGENTLSLKDIATMSQVARQTTEVAEVGCLAGPNLATELYQCHPTATVVASPSKRVREAGAMLLAQSWLHIQTTPNLLAIEWCSVLKNIFAIGSGMLHGLGYRYNTHAFFLTHALNEIRTIMQAIQVDREALCSVAGIGDLVATCGSPSSRNYTVGYRLGKREGLDEILEDMQEVCEGVKTVETIYHFMQSYQVKVPITTMLYRVLFEGLLPQDGVLWFMNTIN